MTGDRARKEAAELAFWESRALREGVLRNDHYEPFFTAHFGLDANFYRDKAILHIGCGPRGTLEWAHQARIRVGLDPLATAYTALGTSRHAMQYVAGRAEHIPLAAASFDVVTAFNSLDHVDDLKQAASEICRVVSGGGLFLVLTDVHQHPTILEPSAFGWGVLEEFSPEMEIVAEQHFEYVVFSPEGFGDMYQSLLMGVAFDHTVTTDRYGILSAMLRKRGETK